MFGIGGWELLLIFVIILLVFGAKRLPEIARSLGKATHEFKKAKSEFSSIADETYDDAPKAPPSASKASAADAGEGGEAPDKGKGSSGE